MPVRMSKSAGRRLSGLCSEMSLRRALKAAASVGDGTGSQALQMGHVVLAPLGRRYDA
jgi:hypothetical protein